MQIVFIKSPTGAPHKLGYSAGDVANLKKEKAQQLIEEGYATELSELADDQGEAAGAKKAAKAKAAKEAADKAAAEAKAKAAKEASDKVENATKKADPEVKTATKK